MEASDTEDLIIDDEEQDVDDDDPANVTATEPKYMVNHHVIMDNTQQDIHPNLKPTANTKRGRRVTVVRTHIANHYIHLINYAFNIL